MTGPEYLKPAEAAVILGVGSHRVGEMAREGVIPREAVGTTPGGQRRYAASVIRALRAVMEQEAGT